MSELRNVLDKLNDVEATIAEISKGATEEDALSITLSLKSLEARRDDLKDELAAISRKNFVDVCDYRMLPETDAGRSISAFGGALKDFQELVSVVFDAQTTAPKTRARLDQELLQKTRFDFGYAYSGSLGVVMTIHNERLLAVESDLDRTIASVFALMKTTSSDKISEARHEFGLATVRRLYNWSKLHAQYGISADIKWIRDREVKHRVLVQPAELYEVCRIIEEKREEEEVPVEVQGELVAFHVPRRNFLMHFLEGEPIRGVLAKEFDTTVPRSVPGIYRAMLSKRTVVKYSDEQEEHHWTLRDLQEPN